SRTAAAADPVTVLSVGAAAGDFHALDDICRQAGWFLYRAVTVREALLRLYRGSLPVVISESNAADGDWRLLLEGVEPLPRPPRIIVSSRLADERLWAEVLNLGGFDVLSTPFAASEVRHVVRCAWDSWHQTWGASRRFAAGFAPGAAKLVSMDAAD
ncbi:MAG TPA: hypothetical protein VGS58_08420, partial [Candidatus Sulfopaludibacter sp.]|nr:hypothetical protein [Candidatus Sulfopaludibacter sp.]